MAKRFQATAEAAADCIELPFVAVAIQLANDNSRFVVEIFRQVITKNFTFRRCIYDTNECVGYLTEVLTAHICVVNGNGDVDFVDVCRHSCKVYKNLFVVAVALTCEVVSEVLYGL